MSLFKRSKDLLDLKTGHVSPRIKFRNDELNSKARGLTQIRWVHQSLEDLPKLGLGNFDFIECREVPIIKHFYPCFQVIKVESISLIDIINQYQFRVTSNAMPLFSNVHCMTKIYVRFCPT